MSDNPLSSASENWKRLKNVHAAAVRFQGPASAPARPSTPNSGFRNLLPNKNKPKQPSQTAAFRDALWRLKSSKAPLPPVASKGRENGSQEYLHSLAALLTRFGPLGHLPEWRLVLVDLSQPFAQGNTSEQLVAMQVFDILLHNYTSASPEETLSRWVFLIRAGASVSSDVVNLASRMLRRCLASATDPSPTGILAYRTLQAELVGTLSTLEAKDEAHEVISGLIGQLHRKELVDLAGPALQNLVFLENLLRLAVSTPRSRNYVIVQMIPTFWTVGYAEANAEHIQILELFRRLCQVLPAPTSVDTLSHLMVVLFKHYPTESLASYPVAGLSAIVSSALFLYSSIEGSLTARLAAYITALSKLPTFKKAFSTTLKSGQLDQMPWRALSRLTLEFPSLATRLLPRMYEKVDGTESEFTIFRLAQQYPQDFYQPLFKLVDSVCDLRTMPPLVQSILSMASSRGEVDYWFGTPSTAELLLVLLFLTTVEQEVPAGFVSGKTTLLLLFRLGIFKAALAPEVELDAIKSRVRAFNNVIDAKLHALLRSGSSTLSDKEKTALCMLMTELTLLCGLTQRPLWFTVMVQWCQESNMESELLVMPDWMPSQPTERFAGNVQQASLQLVAATYGCCQEDELYAIADALWRIGVEQAESFSSSSTFLVLQLAERYPNTFLRLVRSDMISDDPQFRLRAVLNTFTLWASRVGAAQPNAISKRPFKGHRKKISFVPTEIGVSTSRPSNTTHIDSASKHEEELLALPLTLISVNEIRLRGKRSSPAAEPELLRRNSSASSRHKSKSVLVPAVATAMAILSSLMDDEIAVISTSARCLLVDALRDSPTALIDALLDLYSSDESRSQALFCLHRILQSIKMFPPAAAFAFFNALNGSIKSLSKDSKESATIQMAQLLAPLAQAAGSLAAFSMRDVRKNKSEWILTYDGALAFADPAPAVFPRSVPGNYEQLSALCAIHISQLRVMASLIRTGSREDAYAIKNQLEQLQLPPLPSTQPGAMHIDRSLQKFLLLSKNIALTWLQMLQTLLSGLSVHFSDKESLAKLLSTVDTILDRHRADMEVVCLACYVYVTAARLHRLFATRAGFIIIVPSLYGVYANKDASPTIKAAIKVTCVNLYSLHQDSFAIQALKAVSELPTADGHLLFELLSAPFTTGINTLSALTGVEIIRKATSEVSPAGAGRNDSLTAEQFFLKLIVTALTAEGFSVSSLGYLGILRGALNDILPTGSLFKESLDALVPFFDRRVEGQDAYLHKEALLLVVSDAMRLSKSAPLSKSKVQRLALQVTERPSAATPEFLSSSWDQARTAQDINGMIGDLQYMKPILLSSCRVDDLSHFYQQVASTAPKDPDIYAFIWILVVSPSLQVFSKGDRPIPASLASLAASVIGSLPTKPIGVLQDMERRSDWLPGFAVPFARALGPFSGDSNGQQAAWIAILQHLLTSTKSLDQRLALVKYMCVSARTALENCAGVWSAMAQYVVEALPSGRVSVEWLWFEGQPSKNDMAVWSFAEFLVRFKTPLAVHLNYWLRELVLVCRTSTSLSRKTSNASVRRDAHPLVRTGSKSRHARSRVVSIFEPAISANEPWISLTGRPSTEEPREVGGSQIVHLEPTAIMGRATATPITASDAAASYSHAASRFVTLHRLRTVQSAMGEKPWESDGGSMMAASNMSDVHRVWMEDEALARVLEELECNAG